MIYDIVHFTPFKSKSFIPLNSFKYNQRQLQRKISVNQTVVKIVNRFKEHQIHGIIHREDKGYVKGDIFGIYHML